MHPSAPPEHSLSEEDREALRAGQHETLADNLLKRSLPAQAGWVREQIWDWDGACTAYLTAGALLDALRVATESAAVASFDTVMARIENSAESAMVLEAVALLRRRRRPMDAARLLALVSDPATHAQALLEAGDRLGAAKRLAAGSQTREALALLTHDGQSPNRPPEVAFAATLAWDLGDPERSVFFAQRAIRAGHGSDALARLLARGLDALGFGVAATMVRPDDDGDSDADTSIPGRYHVSGVADVGLVGGAYVGYDRVNLQEVEIHTLLSERSYASSVDTTVLTAIERFCETALAAARLGHPAIRPVLRAEPRAGLLVLPRAQAPTLRTWIRNPGIGDRIWRARAWIAFLLDGLQTAHRAGLVHGLLLPSQIVGDTLGRPLLSPFGAHHLLGLTATHTGTLDELMMITAPELRQGGTPTVESDLYATGAIYAAILTGEALAPEQQRHQIPASERDLCEALTATEPSMRMAGKQALTRLREPVAVPARVGPPAPTSTGATTDIADANPLNKTIVVEVARSWPAAMIDRLCAHAPPGMQPILDRDGRTITLAPWPEGSATVEDVHATPIMADEAGTRPQDFALEDALQSRLRATSWVRTPSGAWMLALDDLLTR